MMRTKAPLLIAATSAMVIACSSGPSPTADDEETGVVESELIGAQYTEENCDSSWTDYSCAYYSSRLNSGARAFKRAYGNMYRSCPNVDQDMAFLQDGDPTALSRDVAIFEQTLEQLGCKYKTRVGPNNLTGVLSYEATDENGNTIYQDGKPVMIQSDKGEDGYEWFVAYCPDTPTLASLVGQYQYRKFVWSKMYAVNCDFTFSLVHNKRVQVQNISDFAGQMLKTKDMVVVNWDPSDGSQAGANAAGTSSNAVKADAFGFCGSRKQPIKDNRTCMMNSSRHKFFSNLRRCSVKSGKCM
jgi:hypothetical protein